MACGVSAEAVRTVSLTFCADHVYLEWLLYIRFIQKVDRYEEIHDADLRAYLEKQAAISKNSTTADSLDRFVKTGSRTDVCDTNAVSWMRNSFVSYHALVCKHGVGWLTAKNPKIAVQNVIVAVRPEALWTRLQSDSSFGYKNLKSDFRAFMTHWCRLSTRFNYWTSASQSRRPVTRIQRRIKRI